MVCPEHLACALIFRILSNILVVKGGIGPILQVRKIRSREVQEPAGVKTHSV